MYLTGYLPVIVTGCVTKQLAVRKPVSCWLVTGGLYCGGTGDCGARRREQAKERTQRKRPVWYAGIAWL